jgi:hypothetical protein
MHGKGNLILKNKKYIGSFNFGKKAGKGRI